MQAKDSLAGVSLKYGIALPELRRANQLWTSDSIHIRKVLYIPVDKTRQAIYVREALIDSTPRPDRQSPSHAQHSSSRRDSPPPAEANLPDIGKLTIRRIPASQLSYFPPPSNPQPALESERSRPLQASATLPNGRSDRSRSALPSAFTRAPDNPLQGIFDAFASSFSATAKHAKAYSHAPGSFFSGPVVRAPATLASRLSLDSASGTPSSTSDDLEWEHELDDVPSSRARARRGTATATTIRRQASASLNASPPAPPPPPEARDSVELDWRGPEPATPTHRRSGSSRSRSDRTSPRSVGKIVPYAATDVLGAAGGERGPGEAPTKAGPVGAVRTAQMEPSPGMTLPAMGLGKR